MHYVTVTSQGPALLPFLPANYVKFSKIKSFPPPIKKRIVRVRVRVRVTGGGKLFGGGNGRSAEKLLISINSIVIHFY